MSQYIKTYGRIRPSAKGNATALIATDKTVRIESDNVQKTYELHGIFKFDSTQEDVFSCVAKKIVEDSAEGFNGTIFAYGQTGSGKTHTMLGPCSSWSEGNQKGLIPRSVEYLFQLLDNKAQECQKFTFAVDVEFVELYNEDIFDLLNSKNKVQLRDSGKDIQLVGAKVETVDNSLDLMHIVERGWQARSTGSTAMNAESSRSHAMLIIKIRTEERTGELVKERFSTLNLVDLAGSERQSHTKSTGDRLKEATNINSSLTVLGRCIRILSKPLAGNNYVPYRDSHLTHILKNSLGGNSKTAVIVNMHPDHEFLSETNSTLIFAQSCTMIKNAVMRNEVMTGDQENSYKKAIQELRKEVDEARAKAREEFARRLEDLEESQRRLAHENDSLKWDNADLRAKYNIALLKYSAGNEQNEIVNDFRKILLQNEPNTVDFVAKIQTLMLECEASEKRNHQLQQELNDIRNKYKDNINNTIQMQTPRPKDRISSSRRIRRETQYRPSPARLAMLADDNESNDADDNSPAMELRIAELELEVQTWRGKFEEASENEFKAQKKFAEKIATLERHLADCLEKLSLSDEECKELVEKVERGSKNLDSLLSQISMRDQKVAELEETKREVEERLGKEMEDMRNHYISHINSLEDNDKKSIASLQQEIKELSQKLETKAHLISSLEQEIKKKGKQISDFECQLNQNISSLSNYHTLKRNLEESKLNEENWKKICEERMKDIQVQFQDHQKDLKALRAKKDSEIKSLERSLENAKLMLVDQESAFKAQQNKEQRKFEDKMADIDKRFKEMHVNALKKQEETIRRESMTAQESALNEKDKRIQELDALIKYYKEQHDADTTTIKTGLGSKENKMSYIDKLRSEKAELEKTVAQQRSEIDQLRKLSRETSRPVLRSRNTK